MKRMRVNTIFLKRAFFLVLIFALMALSACTSDMTTKEKEKEELDVKVEDGVFPEGTPETVIKEAKEYVTKTARHYNQERDEKLNIMPVKIIDAKIVGFKEIPHAVVSEKTAVKLFILEFRLLPDNMKNVVFAGAMEEENGWLTESASFGQPIMMYFVENSGTGEEIWHSMGHSNTLTIDEECTSPEMIEKYGDANTAFAAQMLEKYEKEQKQQDQK